MVPKGAFNRPGLEDLVKRRFFYAPAFSIYGGVYVLCVIENLAMIDFYGMQVLPGCMILVPPVVP